MKRICIVTPGQLGSNPRVVKEADTLSAAGYDVHVIATKVADFVEPRDQSILAQARYSVERISLDRKSRRLFGRIRQVIARQAWNLWPKVSLASEASSAMTWHLFKAAVNVKADLYIAHYVAALPAAAMAAAHHNAVYAFDAEDYHLGDHPESQEYQSERQLIQEIEAHYLPGAAYVTASSPLIARAYRDAYPIKTPETVLNTFPRTNSPVAATPCGTVTPGPSVYWFSQTIGPGRGIEWAIQAIALSKSRPHLYLRGTISSAYKSELENLSKKFAVESHLHVVDPVLPSEVERLGAIYDIAFVAEQPVNRNRPIALTNKLFSYLSSGLPVLLSDTEAHSMLVDPGNAYMRLFRDVESLAEGYDHWLCDPDRLAAARFASFEAGQSAFSWEAQSSILKDVVAGALIMPDEAKSLHSEGIGLAPIRQLSK